MLTRHIDKKTQKLDNYSSFISKLVKLQLKISSKLDDLRSKFTSGFT
jgi:hypothetical protein